MACTRSVATRASLLARRYRPPVLYSPDVVDRREHSHDDNLSGPVINKNFQPSFFGGIPNASLGFGFYFQDRGCYDYSLSPTTGSASCRYMSTDIGVESGGNECVSDAAEVLLDTNPEILSDTVDATVGATVDVVASQVPVLSEIAVSVADSWPPIAAVQHLINYVHVFTGLNWWASIALTTILIRGATIPLLINVLKNTAKFNKMAPRLNAVKQEYNNSTKDHNSRDAFRKQMMEIYQEYGVTPLTPFKGLFIQGPLFFSFFIAIATMTDKIPSFKEGGLFWFTDLTTRDATYIFPFMAGLTFVLIIEFTMDTGIEGNPMAATMKKIMRCLAVSSIFFTRLCPKALFCYWITSNIFSLVFGLVIKNVAVREYFGVPAIPAPAQPNYAWLTRKPETQAK